MSSGFLAGRCRRTLLATLLTAGLLVGACGGADDPLLIYSGRGEELVGPLIDEFRRSSGLEVEVRYAGSTELAATLLEEGSGTEADVFLAQDPASLGLAAPLMATLPSEVIDAVAPRFRDRSHRWVGVSGRIRTVIYDRDQVQVSDLPAGIDDLLNPRWAGMIGVAPTNGSFLAFVAAMILDRGEAATLEWLKDLAALDPLDYPKNSPIVAAADAGEVGLGLVNHYYLERFLEEHGQGFGARNHYIGNGDPGALVLVAGVGILAPSENQDIAEEFVEFLLSAPAQTYFAQEIKEYPVSAGVEPEGDLPPLESLNPPNVDLGSLSDLEGTLKLLRETEVLP